MASTLEAFLATMPDAVEWALGASKDPRWGRAVSFGTGSVLQYLFDEDDLFPESRFGVLGLIDDAFLVHAFVGALHATLGLPLDGDAYRAPDREVIAVVATLLPQGVADALRRTADGLVTIATAIFAPAPTLIDLKHSMDPVLRGAAAAHALAANGA